MIEVPIGWGSHQISPSLWLLLHPELREMVLPKVPRVSCQQCRRAREGTARWDVRCCDVTPQLPNFLVGEILRQGGHVQLDEWLQERRGDPYFMLVPPIVARAHIDAREGGLYGLRCPFLLPEEGVCSIYTSRPALCVGYHCYYPSQSWQEAFACLTSLLDLYQHAAARQLVASADLDLSQIASVFEQCDEHALWEGRSQRASAYTDIWQHWHGREREYYEDCYERLHNSPDTFRAKMLALHRRQLSARFAAIGALSPERERALAKEDEDADEIRPLQPPGTLRGRLRQGTLHAIDNPHTIREMESYLLWLCQQIKSGGLAALWRWLWPADVATSHLGD